MHSVHRLLSATLALSLCASVVHGNRHDPRHATAAATPVVSLQDQMSAEQFSAAGLNKLSPAELAALEAWLNGFSAEVATATEAQLKDQLGVRLPELLPDRIESRIVGDFRGWDGKTVFVLENGQVWRQRQPGSVYHVAKNPKVVIQRGPVCSRLSVGGMGTRVGVSRID
jgi:hypothetical protein